MTGESDVTESTTLVMLVRFFLWYSRALRGMTTGWNDIDCLEKRGVVAGPNGDDDIQLSSGLRETEGPGAVDGRGVRGEYVWGMCTGVETVVDVKEVERLCPNGAWVGGGGNGSSLACRRKRLEIVLLLLTCVRGPEALCA